jgi:phosphate uptake regulator
MEHRKIIALGKSSNAVTLPKDWLKENHLKKGDFVIMHKRNDGGLILQPYSNEHEEPKKICLSIRSEETPNSIKRRVIGSFLDGYSLITLKSDKIFTGDQQEAIREISRRLYMLVISSESSNIQLETIIDEAKASISSCIDRMHMITFAMLRDVIEAFEKYDKELSMSVISLEEDVDQLMYLVLRIIRNAVQDPGLAGQLSLEPLDCLDFQTLVQLIERVADNVTGIAESQIKIVEEGVLIPERLKITLLDAAKMAFKSYEEAVHCFMYKDIEPTNKIINRQDDIRDIYLKITPMPLSSDFNSSQITQVIGIRENIMDISSLSADIAELTIDRVSKYEKAVKA